MVIANGTYTIDMEDRIGEGRSAAVYAGYLLNIFISLQNCINLHSNVGQSKDGTKVAVKIFYKNHTSQESYSIELDCYEKLGATHGDQCEKYGIPPILYHGPGADSLILVMPRYNSDLIGLRTRNINVSDESWFYMMQQLVCIIYNEIAQSLSLIIFALFLGCHVKVRTFEGSSSWRHSSA